MNEDQVLELLKEKLCKVMSFSEDKFSPENMQEKHSNKAKFYLKNSSDNLYKREKHSKLDKRSNAIKSSAAMIFNTLGKDSFYWCNKKYNQIKYEEELEAILSGNDKSHNAHLDVRFIAEDDSEIVFVESKLLEWFSSPKNLSPSYLEQKQYINTTGEKKKDFINFFKSLLQEPNKKDSKGCFVGKFRKYDALQMTIHILGIYNFFVNNKQYKHIRLLNIVWDNKDCKQYQNEVIQAKEYITMVNKSLVPIFGECVFEVEYIPYSEFYSKLEFEDKSRKEYLKRYLLD